MTARLFLPPTPATLALVAALGGKWHGRHAMCRCPAHRDRTPSLSIRQGTRGILVHCFAGCDPRDVLKALPRTGQTEPGRTEPSRYPSDTTHIAQRLWERGQAVPGTLAAAYLAARGLPGTLPDIRYLDDCPLGCRPRTSFHPALLVAVRDQGRVVAVQRIVLDPATVHHRGKFLLGACRQGAWGPQPTGKTLAIAEGFEDAAAFSLIHAIPCWAALGASRLARIRLPDHVSHLIIAADDDRAGRLAALQARRDLARPGLAIDFSWPPAAKDWADLAEALSYRVTALSQDS